MITRSSLIALWAELFDSYGDRTWSVAAMQNFCNHLYGKDLVKLVGLNISGDCQVIDKFSNTYGIGEFDGFCEKHHINFTAEEYWEPIFSASSCLPLDVISKYINRFLFYVCGVHHANTSDTLIASSSIASFDRGRIIGTNGKEYGSGDLAQFLEDTQNVKKA